MHFGGVEGIFRVVPWKAGLNSILQFQEGTGYFEYLYFIIALRSNL